MAKQAGRKREKQKKFYDYTLLFVIIFLSCFGLIMIYSTSYYTAQLKLNDPSYYMRRQASVLLLGLVVMIIVSKFDYHRLMKLAPLGYLISLVLMVLVDFTPFGIEYNGKKRWFGIGGHSLFQPTELVKITIILMMAAYIVKYLKMIDRRKTIIWMLLLTVPLIGLVAKNNLSSGIIIAGIVFVMYFVASKRKTNFVVLILLGTAVVVAAIVIGPMLVKMGVLQAYQLNRIMVWQSPEAYASDGGFQVLQGLYAIGSGGIFGKGLGNSIQKLGFVPEAQNDMIFAIICEELGLFGAACLILLFLFMLYRFLVIANNAPDLMGSLIVIGAMSHIAIQVILNIAVVTNTIPNTGITLPFISYGGTSLLFLMLEMGLVLSVSNRITLE